MLEVIEKLLILQDRDRKIRRVQAELAHIEPERQTLKSKASGAQTNLDANFCGLFEPLYQTVITEVPLNQEGKAAAWIDSYGAYKVIIQYTQNKLYRAREVCQAGGGAIGKSEFSEMRRAIDAAAIAAARAYDVLKNANLLGQ